MSLFLAGSVLCYDRIMKRSDDNSDIANANGEEREIYKEDIHSYNSRRSNVRLREASLQIPKLQVTGPSQSPEWNEENFHTPLPYKTPHPGSHKNYTNF